MKKYPFISLLLAILPLSGMAQQKKPVDTNVLGQQGKWSSMAFAMGNGRYKSLGKENEESIPSKGY